MSRAYVFDCWCYAPDCESTQVIEDAPSELQARFRAIDQHREQFGLCSEHGPLVRANLEDVVTA